jgi:hypothetical protein
MIGETEEVRRMTKEKLHRKCVQSIKDNGADLVTCDGQDWHFVKPVQYIEPPEEIRQVLQHLVQEVVDDGGQDDAIYYLRRKLGEEDV